MYDLEQQRKEIVYVQEMLWRWQDSREKQDAGSYCENSSRAYQNASRKVNLLKKLLKELLES